MALSQKGYVRLVLGAQNSVNVELTEKVTEYEKKMGLRTETALGLLFSDFDEKELSEFYKLYKKLHTGVERLEKGTE